MSGTNVQKRALRARAEGLRIELARRDPDVFMSMVLRDEETSKTVTQGPYHSEWQKLLTDHKRLIIWSHVESGKTQQLSIGRVIWELGRDPSLRVVVVSNTGMQAQKLVKAVGTYIDENEALHKIFPGLTRGGTWTGDSITVKRDTPAKDPSLQALGMHGNILGARIDLLILDDILDYENTRTDYQRREAQRWVESTLFGRLTRRARCIFVGNAWHREDMMHNLAVRPGWKGFKFPVETDGIPVWPDRWPVDRLIDKREELGPLEFARQMMCEARAEGQSRFRLADIDLCKMKGRGKKPLPFLSEVPPGCSTFTGVDLAISRKKGASKTVFFTLLMHSDGTREVINVEAGRWTASEILARLENIHKRFKSRLVVENNAAQDFLVQLATDKQLPITPHTTGRNKTHPTYGVESLSAEMSRGQWIIPCEITGECEKEIQEWIDQMLYYDPASHTGDHLMASWIAREGSRKGTFAHRVAFGGVGTPGPLPAEEMHACLHADNHPDRVADKLWDELYSTLDFDA